MVTPRAPTGGAAAAPNVVFVGKETAVGVSAEIDPELTAGAAALTVDRAGRTAISFAGRRGGQLGQSVKIADERR